MLQSTASFFQDQSVSLGRLIGIKPPNKDQIGPDERSNYQGVPKCHEGLCAPLIHHVIGKMARSGSTSRR
ncbi:hypothetical protein CDL12_18834 [Handroanthus impetiginosus]|uniref:Uncharacterized protein n=1 Tax=Handroanthus impetiginosus TaxID=429701 RepID=A0A2G9GTM5_9LAMI|nr:hypothetical protein CDL12_18834 [Handroanthus impetiginosus]